MRTHRLFVSAAAVLTMTAAACGSSSPAATGDGLGDLPPEVHVLNAWTPPTTRENASLYFQAHNAGARTDRLVGATCDCAFGAEVHEMAGGTMQPVAGVDIPSDTQVTFTPGSYHVLLIGLDGPLKAGDFITVTFRFELAGEVTVDAEVRAGAPDDPGMASGMPGMG